MILKQMKPGGTGRWGQVKRLWDHLAPSAESFDGNGYVRWSMSDWFIFWRENHAVTRYQEELAVWHLEERIPPSLPYETVRHALRQGFSPYVKILGILPPEAEGEIIKHARQWIEDVDQHWDAKMALQQDQLNQLRDGAPVARMLYLWKSFSRWLVQGIWGHGWGASSRR